MQSLEASKPGCKYESVHEGRLAAMEPTLKDILRRRGALLAIMDQSLQDIECNTPLRADDLLLCADCVTDYDRLVETKCKLAQDNLKMYVLAKSKLDEYIHEINESNDRQLNDEIKEINVNIGESQQILDSLTSEYNSLMKEVYSNQSLLGLIHKKTNDEMQQIDANTRELRNLDLDLQYLVELGNNSKEEVLYLTEITQFPNRIDPLVNIVCSPDVPYAGMFNGIRLNYCELPEIGLSIMEINIAWGILGLSLCMLRNKNNLTHTLRFRVVCKEATKFMHVNSIKINPLKDKTMLSICYSTENIDNGHVSSYHNESLWLDGDNDEYNRSITAFAAALAMTIIELNLFKCVDAKATVLNTILSEIKNNQTCGYECITDKGIIAPSKRCNMCNISYNPTMLDCDALVYDIVYTMFQICK